MSLSEQVRNLLLRENWTPVPYMGSTAYITDKIDSFHCSIVGNPESWVLGVEINGGKLSQIDAGTTIDELTDTLVAHYLIEPEDDDSGKWDDADSKLSMAYEES